jgi:RecA-family ATPase
MVPEAVSNRKVRGMQYLQNREIYDEIILKRLQNASKRMRIATANIKDVQVASGRSYISILKVMRNSVRALSEGFQEACASEGTELCDAPMSARPF